MFSVRPIHQVLFKSKITNYLLGSKQFCQHKKAISPNALTNILLNQKALDDKFKTKMLIDSIIQIDIHVKIDILEYLNAKELNKRIAEAYEHNQENLTQDKHKTIDDLRIEFLKNQPIIPELPGFDIMKGYEVRRLKKFFKFLFPINIFLFFSLKAEYVVVIPIFFTFLSYDWYVFTREEHWKDASVGEHVLLKHKLVDAIAELNEEHQQEIRKFLSDELNFHVKFDSLGVYSSDEHNKTQANYTSYNPVGYFDHLENHDQSHPTDPPDFMP